MKEQATSQARQSSGARAADSNGTVELLEEGLAEAKELVGIQISLAREEALTQLRSLKQAAIALGAAVALGLTGLSALLTALIVAAGWVVGVALSGTLVVVATAIGIWGRSKIPQHPMTETKDRIVDDANSVRRKLS